MATYTGLLVDSTYWRKNVNKMSPVARIVGLGDRIQYLDSSGNYTGAQSMAVGVIADTGGISANDIVYVSGYDSTTGYPKVKPADADTAAKARDLYWAPSAIAEDATGYVRKDGVFTSALSGTIGDPVYLTDDTAGGVELLAPTGGDTVVEVGTLATTGGSGVVHISLAGERILIHTHADNAQGGTLTTPALSGTSNATFQIEEGTTDTLLELSSAASGGSTNKITLIPHATMASDRVLTFPDPGGADSMVYLGATQILTNKTLTTPTIGDLTNATHDHADAAGGGNTLTIPTIGDFTLATHDHSDNPGGGTLTTPALSGTSITTWTVNSGGNQLILSSSGLGANRTFTFPDNSGAVITDDATQTLSGKTLSNPSLVGGALTLSADVTVTGTWTDLGIVTTVDINGGSIDGVTIGGSAAGAGSFTTLGTTGTATLNDVTVGGGYGSSGVTIDAAGVVQANGAITSDGTGTFATVSAEDGATPTITTASGKTNTGYVQVNGKTSGAIKILPIDTGTNTTTIQNQAGTITVTLPSATSTLPGLGLANTFTAAQIVGLDHANNNDTQDVLTLKRSVAAGNATTNVGLGVSLFLENDAGTEEEHASIDIVATSAANGTEDTDFIVSTMLNGSVTEAMRLDASDQSLTLGRNSSDADGIASVRIYPVTASRGSLILSAQAHASADRSTTLQNATDGGAAVVITLPSTTCTLPGIGLANTLTAVQTVTLDDTDDGVSDPLILKHTSSDNNPTALDGAGISFELENDANAIEEWASIDVLSTAITNGSEDADLVISTMLAGTVTEAARIDASDQSLTIGRDATDANGLYQLRMFPLTTAKGSLLLQATANTGDTVTAITNAAQTQATTLTIPDVNNATAGFVMTKGSATCTGTLDISGATVTYRSIVNGDISASAGIVRSKMAEESLAVYGIPFQDLRNGDATVMDATGGAAAFNLNSGGFGVGTMTIETEAAAADTKTDTLMFEFVMPPEYVASGDVKLVLHARETDEAQASTTLSAEVYESDGEAAVSGNLYNAFDNTDITTSWQTCTSTVTDANLVAGDRLIVFIRMVVDDTAGAGGQAEIGKIEIQCDIKG